MAYKNKEDQIACQRRWYQNNKQKRIDEVALRREKTIEWVEKYKAEHGCHICGEAHSACLDFHHTNPNEKDGCICKMIHCGCSKETLLNEIKKCVILCSNCHRKLHYIEKT